MNPTPLASVVEEAARLVPALDELAVQARLVGGLGVAAHDHVDVPASLTRDFMDIDLVVPAKTGRRTAEALKVLGYTANQRFNALHGAHRLLFYDVLHRRQLDVFVGDFVMCHRLNLEAGLNQHPVALSAADLLLTKLQIVELNNKDVVDTVRLLLNHELSDEVVDTSGNSRATPSGPDMLSITRVVSVTCADWGWHTTITDNLAKIAAATDQLLSTEYAKAVRGRAQDIADAMNAAPKKARWHARAALGRRVAWYELPEEVSPTGRTPRG